MRNLTSNHYHTPYFLATTALEEFWDPSRRQVFLGDWCCRYSRKKNWDTPGNEVLSSPWHDRTRYHQAVGYINDVCERLLPKLTEIMNDIHGVQNSERYWRIILLPWLMHYVHVLFDRYTCLMEAFKQYPDLTTVGLSEDCFVTPRDTLDFCSPLAWDDLYNLQIYTNILDYLGKIIPKNSVKPSLPSRGKSSIRQNLRDIACHLLNKLPYPPITSHSIILADTYFPSLIELKLLLLAGKRLKLIKTVIYKSPSFPLNFSARYKLKNFILKDYEFEHLLIHLLPLDMPQCFIEGFDWCNGLARKVCPKAPKAMFSGVGWYFNEIFKQIAAGHVEKGGRLIGSQHGGNYGSIKYLSAEEHELHITDQFYSWGWTRSDCNSRVVPFWAGKLSGSKKFKPDNQKEGILFAGEGMPRYFNRNNYYGYAFNEYLAWQMRFTAQLDSSIRKRMRCRLFHEDYGWDMKKLWQDSFPEVVIEDFHKIYFLKSLENCRLFVCDHLGTTFIEALSADKPAILFWDPTIFEIKEDAIEYYELLREMEILFYDPEEAARKINSIYEDVESWWNQPELQRAVKTFCQRFARTSKDSVTKWAQEFIRLTHET